MPCTDQSPVRAARGKGGSYLLPRLLLIVVFSASVMLGAAPRLLGERDETVDHGQPAPLNLSAEPGYSVFEETWRIVDERYVDLTALDSESLFLGASAGLVDALGDAGHSRFLTPQQAEEFNRSINSQVIGIGVSLRQFGEHLVVDRVIENGPAEREGVRKGDVLLAVSGESIRGLDSRRVVPLLRGDEGTSVELRFYRPAERHEFDVDLRRQLIDVIPVSWAMMPDRVGFIRIDQFSAGTTDALAEALERLQRRGTSAIVLDLRDNPGGLVTEALGVASHFLPEGSVLYLQQGRDGRATEIRTVGEGNALNVPLVVLVNRGSASAAEIVAASIRDNGRGVMIGETTYGTGTVLMPVTIEGGSMVVIGTSLWLTPAGDLAWKVGVEPNTVINLPFGMFPTVPRDDGNITRSDLAAIEDPQVRAAHGYVLAMIDPDVVLSPPPPPASVDEVPALDPAALAIHADFLGWF